MYHKHSFNSKINNILTVQYILNAMKFIVKLTWDTKPLEANTAQKNNVPSLSDSIAVILED